MNALVVVRQGERHFHPRTQCVFEDDEWDVELDEEEEGVRTIVVEMKDARSVQSATSLAEDWQLLRLEEEKIPGFGGQGHGSVITLHGAPTASPPPSGSLSLAELERRFHQVNAKLDAITKLQQEH